MTERSIRRAAERKANKQARKAKLNPPSPTPATTPIANPEPAADAQVDITPATTISPSRLAANQANAQLSTGPRTEAGKLISSKNALKTALTGKTVLLPTDDVAAYESLLAAALNDFNPATTQERELLQSIVDSTWRIQRIMNLEFGIFTKGSLEFADEFPELGQAARAQMIQVETFLKYEKSLRNLNTQEARLRRSMVKDTLELHRLQAERRQQEDETRAFIAARPPKPASTPNLGFEFSKSEMPGLSFAAPMQSIAPEQPHYAVTE